MESTTFTTKIPKPKGWQPRKQKPKKLVLFSVIASLLIKFKLWRKHTWFSLRYPVNYTHNLTWIAKYKTYLGEVYKLRDKVNTENKLKTKIAMEIYLLEQDWNNDYNTYDSVVVIAENEKEARKIHPSEFVTHITDGQWMSTYATKGGGEYNFDSRDWVQYDEIERLKIKHIGTATDKQEKGVLLASFNAG